MSAHPLPKLATIRGCNLTVTCLLALSLMACSSISLTSSTPTPLPAGLSGIVSGKVDVGGYELYYTCVGEGSPTVVIEAGGADVSASWELVMLYYQGYTRICAYDRANLGNSDKALKPRTFDDMTRDLHVLLEEALTDAPYILVGHSMGGMLVRLYTYQYPEDVVGLVLVDSAHPDMGARLLALLPPETRGEDKSLKSWRQYATWVSISDGRTTFDAEGVNYQISNKQVRAVKSLGDLPLAVISRSPDNPVLVSFLPSLPDDINARLMQQWQEMQTELEGLSSNSTRFTAAHSGHGVMVEEPRLVVEAIRHVLDEYWVISGMIVPPAQEPTSAASHVPQITGITQREEWQNGTLFISEDISFKDPAGDAITIINSLVSASNFKAAISDDVIRSSAAEQQQGAVLTSSIRCRQEFEVVIEYRVFDAAGNTSNPETVTISCPAPRFYISPVLIAGIVLILAISGLVIWALARYIRRRRAAAS